MPLTKEELDNIKLPLSEEDYKMLREEDARSGYKIWRLASPELRVAFDKREAERVDDIPSKRFLNHTTGKIADFDRFHTKLYQLIRDCEDTDDDLNTTSSVIDMGKLLGEIGCDFRNNIEYNIRKYLLNNGDDVEWLLEPLDEISHPADYVLDAFQISTPWESIYELYFHFKNATSIYIPFDKPLKRYYGIRKEGNTIHFDDIDYRDEFPKPKPFEKSMIIKDDLNPLASKAIPSIWDQMVVPFTTVGIWQAVLLNETPVMFPKGWHANYMKKTYVFSKEDMQMIINHCETLVMSDSDKEKLSAYLKSIDRPNHHKDEFTTSDLETLKYYLDRMDIMPSVKIEGDNAIASFYYWNDWSGFCKMKIHVERKGLSVTFGEQEEEVLVKYDCRIDY